METKLTVIGAGAILLLDILTSLLSVHLHLSLRLLCLATPAVYLGVAYWAAKYLNIRGTLAFGAFLGLIDTTIGWKLCSSLGADQDFPLEKMTFNRWCTMAVWVVIFGAVMALIAFLIASARNKRESR